MAINEIVKDSAYRVWDDVNKIWKKYAFWTRGSRVEYDDGNTGEMKHGAINGITSSLVSNSPDIAASAAAVYKLNSDFACGQMEIRLVNGKGEYREKGADTWIPFSRCDPMKLYCYSNTTHPIYIPTNGRDIRITLLGSNTTERQGIIAYGFDDTVWSNGVNLGYDPSTTVCTFEGSKNHKYVGIKYNSGSWMGYDMLIEWL